MRGKGEVATACLDASEASKLAVREGRKAVSTCCLRMQRHRGGMCARYTDTQIYFKFFRPRRRLGKEELEPWEELKLGESLTSYSWKGPSDAEPHPWRPRYNVAPTQRVRVIYDFAPDYIELARWGYVVPWTKAPVINARAETVATKRIFKEALRSRRCLMVADGFIEWRTEGSSKRPFHFTLPNGEVFFFAGLWEDSHDPKTGEEVKACVNIIREPNELVSIVHDRMPVILPADRAYAWLNPEASEAEIQALLEPLPVSMMKAQPASPAINSSKVDYPDLLNPEHTGAVTSARVKASSARPPSAQAEFGF